MNGNFKRNLLVSFGVSMFILILSSTASYLSIRSLLESNKLVNHTQEVIYNVNAAGAEMLDAQTSMRGFLITGKMNFVNEISITKEKTDTHFDNISQLTVDNSTQQNALQQIIPLKNNFFKYLDVKIGERNQGQNASSGSLDMGKMLMDDIQMLLKRMENEEQRLLKERIATSEQYASYSVALIVAAAIISLIISLLFFIRILNDYNVRTKLQIELEKSDRETAKRINVISEIATQISKGNYDLKVDDLERDALGSMGNSLNNMSLELKNSFNLLSDNEWLQAGIAQLNNVMIGEKTLQELTKDIIEHLAVYTNSNAGIIYLVQGNQLFKVAGYSHIVDKSRETIQIGEGLTGQAVDSKKLLEIKTSSPEDIKISFALGEVKPRHIVAFPLIDGQVAGAIELASIREFSKKEMAFFNAIGNNIGIAIKAALNRKRVQELLEETQAQSEELQIQHSELESMNAELEIHTEKLQASEEELKVQQEELQQTNEELAERSVLLEEQNIEIQKKSEALELSTRYKSEFLANMSHELRTPLNSILLLSRLLAENNDKNMNTEQIEFARVIQSSGNGLLGLIDEILDLSKIEAGKMELEFIDIVTKEITDNLESLFKEVAKEKNIQFNIISDKAPLVIKTDKMRLEQILKNLISNAIKFTSKGSVTLEIKMHDEDEKIICFIVKDTGIGIPKEKQPLIFEAFQQADGSTKRKYGGTGLGLSISRELAKLLKGEITLESTINEGSEFTFCLPVVGSSLGQLVKNDDAFELKKEKSKKESEDKNNYISPVIPEDVPDDRDNITATDKIILIVEDDTNFAKSLLDFTQKRGYKGIVAVRGDHALNYALSFKPVGILLDIQLPVKSGWEVLEELKSNSQTKHIPVHTMSSLKLKQESLLKGAINFLDKPIAYEQMPEIFKKIEHIINQESKKVLIIEDNPKHAQALAFFLETNNINSEIKSEIDEGITTLQHENVNCVILDMGIPDKQAYEILEVVKKDAGLENLPVIVFTGKSLSMQEELKIKKYADSIVVKTAHSYQRMLDEVSIFLHLVEEKKSGNNKAASNKNLNLSNILNNKTVLIVDDDVRNIYSLTKALESLKMNVLTAIDGKEALIALEANPETDVVLLDMMMPNMDGYETATRIRKIAKFKNLPVIAVTAKAMTGDREKCINAGASDYITKPVDVDQLLSLLRVWLYNKS